MASAQNTNRPATPASTDTIVSWGRFHLADALSLPAFDGDASISLVSHGPNKGYYYTTAADYLMPRAYSLSNWIENPGVSYDGGSTTWQWLTSNGYNPALFRSYTIDHEVGAVPSSHLGRHALGGASFAACGQLNQAVERLVFADSANLAFRIALAENRAYDMIEWLSGHQYVYGHQSSPNPVAEWYYTVRPGARDGLLDVQDTNPSAQPHSTHCNGTGV